MLVFLPARIKPIAVEGKEILAPRTGSGLRPKSCTSDVEQMLESALAGMRKPDSARIAHPRQPIHLEKVAE
jgi:hypothetical protein